MANLAALRAAAGVFWGLRGGSGFGAEPIAGTLGGAAGPRCAGVPSSDEPIP